MSKAVKQMETGIQKVKTEMKQHLKPQDRSDKFYDQMKVFVQHAEDRFKKVQEVYQLMDKKFEDLSKYYVFDRKKISIEEFFGDLTTFIKDFDVRS